MLTATRRELERGFRLHQEHSGAGDSSSHKLLLFYSAECGVKALILRDRRLDDTSGLPDKLRSIGHDLNQLLMELHAPKALIVRSTMTRQKKRQSVHCPQLHQAYRYSIGVDNEQELIEQLGDIINWIRGRMQ